MFSEEGIFMFFSFCLWLQIYWHKVICRIAFLMFVILTATNSSVALLVSNIINSYTLFLSCYSWYKFIYSSSKHQLFKSTVQ